jgi:hypothetical protein
MEGESGPKARPNGVVDGKQVNIPVLFLILYRGTKKALVGQIWILTETSKVMRGRRKTLLELRGDTGHTSITLCVKLYVLNLVSNFQEKLALLIIRSTCTRNRHR